jgi:hypothetical protein
MKFFDGGVSGLRGAVSTSAPKLLTIEGID